MVNKHTQQGFSIIEVSIVIVTAAIIGVLGWKFYDAQSQKTQTNNTSSETAAVDIQPENLTELTEINTIQDKALADKPGVTVIHIELEKTDAGTLVYKAQLSDGTVTVYNARTGAHIRSLAEKVTASEVLPADFTSGIGFAKAVEIARVEKPNSKVQKIELEYEGGVVVYSVRFTDKARVDVNATTGAIVRTKAAKSQPAAVQSNNSANSGNTKATTASSQHTSRDDSSHNRGSSTDDSSSSTSHHSGSDDSRHSGGDDDDRLSDNDDDDDSDGDDDSGKDDSDDNSGRNRGRD